MRGYREITSQEEMDTLLASIDGFHDSMTKELHLMNRGYVLPDHSMAMSHRFDAQILIHSQFPPGAIELLFIEIENMAIGAPGEYGGATGVICMTGKRVEKQIIEMTFDTGDLRISAGRLFCRVRSEWLGQQARFGDEVPMPEAIPAATIQGNWRQCSGCCNAWEEDPLHTFAICPECNAMTELHEGSAEQGCSEDAC